MNPKKMLRVVCAVMIASSTAVGGDSDVERKSLAGLSGVQVLIELPSPQIAQAGITTDLLRTDTELKLRLAGIKVLSDAEASLGDATLYVEVVGMTVEMGDSAVGWAYSVHLGPEQNVRLFRNESIIAIGAETWSTGGIGTVPKSDIAGIRDALKDYIDKFVNAYLAANPKK